MSDVFLTDDEIAVLTGRKTKSKQIEQLRKMVLPFWVNALGKPVVARATFTGPKEAPPPKKQWQPPD